MPKKAGKFKFNTKVMPKILVALLLAAGVAIAILLLTGSSNFWISAALPMDSQLCAAANGNWNECSNSCGIDNQGKGNFCPQVCEPLCECAGMAGFGCPDGYHCKTPSGIADALGFCVLNP